jgi:hypothetical protein
MHFNNPAEVVAWADSAAEVCLLHHDLYDVSKNPYSTDGMRNDWQRGYDNAPPRSFELTQEYDTAYQLGAATKRLELKIRGYVK